MDDTPGDAAMPREKAKLSIVCPASFAEAEYMTQTLLQQKGLVLNLERMNAENKQRLLDYLGGATQVLDYAINQISENAWIITPGGVMQGESGFYGDTPGL
ncbi:MAG: cell division protein SepF [Gemmiger sp.]|nr:cell division protein SepF [Gemmiger sp.]